MSADGDFSQHSASPIIFPEATNFRDGERKIDFVLVYDIQRSVKADLRKSFENHLLSEGLQLEVEPASQSSNDRSRRRSWIRGKSNTANQPCCLSIYPRIKRLLMRVWTQMLPSSDVRAPTPYYVALYNDSRKEQFLIKSTKTFFKDIQRIFIAWTILCRTPFDFHQSTGNVGINKLLNMKVYLAAFPIHDGPVDLDPGDLTIDGRVFDTVRMKLDVTWANGNTWYKQQPINLVREYLGDCVGLYFSFLGFYTSQLIIPAIIGIVAFIFGLSSLSSMNSPSEEICNELGATIMCPTCDRSCDYWRLSDSCFYSRLTYLFDNYIIIVVAVLASLWPNVFMILWERKENALRFHWDMENYENAEQVRPEFEAKAANFRINPVTKQIEPYMTTMGRLKKIVVSFSIVILLLALTGGIFLGIITYRIVVTQFYASMDNRPVSYAKLMAAASGSIINLLVISVLDVVYFQLALRLTAWENHRTETEHEHSLTFKLFLFQCVNYYSAIVYIALFKGKFAGRPGAYRRMLGVHRAEECDQAGCFIEFSIMCITVMLGKQMFALFYEVCLYPYIISRLWMAYNRMDFSCEGIKSEVKATFYNLKQALRRNKYGSHYKPLCNQSRWEKDYSLEALPSYGLLYEYLELVIQYGFVTLFLVGFPLAPLFALINNVIELKIDSHKILAARRRPYLVRAHGIGIWQTIFKAVSKLSIFVNAVILAWTSDIINKLLYVTSNCNPGDVINSPHLVAACGRMWDGVRDRQGLYLTNPSLALRGYIRYTLSKFDVNDWEAASQPLNNGSSIFGEEVRYCFYKDFRYGPQSTAKYELTKEYWHVLASKLALVICFEQTLILMTSMLTMCIPIRSATIDAQRQRAKFLANEAIHDLERERSRQHLHQRKRSALNRINFNDANRYI